MGANDLQGSYESLRGVVSRTLQMARYSQAPSDRSPHFPPLIHVEPTNACNLRCVHCHHHVGNNPSLVRPFGIMKMDVFAKVVEEAAALNCAVTLNVQGEPTLHPRFVDMVAALKDKGIFVSIITNGTRMTEELARALLGLGLDRVVFSFDAIDKDIYEAVRVRSKFEPTLANILRFLRLNEEHGHRTHVCMSMVLQDRTRGQADDYRRYFERLPVDKIFLNEVLNLSGASGVSDEIDVPALKRQAGGRQPVCRIPWEDLTVNWDGEVCPCPVDVNLVYSVGNVRDTSLLELWNSERMRTFRNAHLTGDFSAIEGNGPLCSGCNSRWSPEYDLRHYPDYAVDAICRAAAHHAPGLVAPRQGAADVHYQNLLECIANIEGTTAGNRPPGGHAVDGAH